MKTRLPTIIIDTREQRPLEFRGFQTSRRKLEAGDYSVRGMTHEVAVERKSRDDLFGTMAGSKNRERFEKELIRASDINMTLYIVVEASLWNILNITNKRTRINPRSMVDSLMTLSASWGVRVMFADDRDTAARLVQAILVGHWRAAGGDA